MADSLSKGVNLSRDIKKTASQEKVLTAVRDLRPIYEDSFSKRPSRDNHIEAPTGENAIKEDNSAYDNLGLSFGKQGTVSQLTYPTLTFCIGLPASGKTTWALNQVNNSTKIVRVNRDDLRNMRGTYWIPKQEDMITEWELQCVIKGLEAGRDVIMDSTNLDKKRRQKFAERIIALTDQRFIIQDKSFLDVPVSECVKRDKNRSDGNVGSKVILKMATKYGLKDVYPEYRHQAGLPCAIVVDLDGTLAQNKSGRGWYDHSRVGEDTIDPTIHEIIKQAELNGTKIIVMSGRDGVCRPETTKWLKDNEVHYEALLMRQENDNRQDAIIKKELYELYIKDTYNVLYALDDRNQVVDMWRKELGIKCLQENYGDL